MAAERMAWEVIYPSFQHMRVKDDSKSFFAYARSITKSTVKAGVSLNNGGVKTDSITEITE